MTTFIAKRRPITSAELDAERERRLEAGAVIIVTGYGPVAVQGRERDMVIYVSLKDSAQDLINAGATTVMMPFRDRDNVVHMLTPAQIKELITNARSVAQSIYTASWALKDTPRGIPYNYTDSTKWPDIQMENF